MSTAPLLIGILLSCSLPQLIGAIICFRRGEILLASIAGLFGTVITLGAAFTLYQLAIQAPAPGAFTPEVMGAFWITLFVITEIFAIGFGRMSWFLLLGIAEVGVSFLFLGINALTGSMAAGAIAGYLLIIFSAFCIYSSAAILWGEHFQRPILPLGRPVFK
jgi:succinate-acetate transporter protein